VTESGRALVIVPTYNERCNVHPLLRHLFDIDGDGIDVLVVDDASPDGTAAEITKLTERHGCLHLIERPAKLGLGSAYVVGFKWAMNRGYDAVVEMDADLSHDPCSVPRLLAALDDAELVIGSRYVAGGSIENWGRFRRLLSRAGNAYARVLLGFDVADSTSGFRAYRSSVLRHQDLGRIRSEGYAFQIEMTHRVWLARGRIREVPITFTERRAGQSKLSRRIIFEALWRVPFWAVKHRRGSRTDA
jgi:glycosyltransferase involved in cell wall biosynthesis